jgi:hypothetical protein
LCLSLELPAPKKKQTPEKEEIKPNVDKKAEKLNPEQNIISEKVTSSDLKSSKKGKKKMNKVIDAQPFFKQNGDS